MKIVLAVVVVIALAALGSVYAQRRFAHPADGGALEAALDAEFDKVRKGHAPDAALLVAVYKDGRTWFKTAGQVRSGAPAEPDMRTLFQIGSITKVFTAATAQALVDRGVLRWDDTVASMLPPGYAVAPGYRGMTLRQLATHTAGLPSIPADIERAVTARAPQGDIEADPYSFLRLDDVLRQLATLPGQQQAGGFEYSNYGMGLLGHLMALRTGRPYAELVTQHVLAPAGMTSSSIGPRGGADGRDSMLADGHDAEGRAVAPWTFGALEAAGACHSSGEDLIRFVRVSLDPSSPLSALLAATARPQASGQTGLGWMQPMLIDRLAGNTAMVWHNGMTGGYAAYLAIDRDRRVGVAVLSAQARDMTFFGSMLMRAARTQSWGSPADDRRPRESADPG